jgi:hypothetical protein
MSHVQHSCVPNKTTDHAACSRAFFFITVYAIRQCLTDDGYCTDAEVNSSSRSTSRPPSEPPSPVIGDKRTRMQMLTPAQRIAFGEHTLESVRKCYDDVWCSIATCAASKGGSR